MAADFLSDFMGSQVRARLLRVFIFSQPRALGGREAAKRAGVSLPTAEREIAALQAIGVLKRSRLSAAAVPPGSKGKREGAWAFDMAFRHALALSRFVHEVSPVRHNTLLARLRRGGRVATVVLSGSFVGDPTRPADLLLAVEVLSERRLEAAIRSVEKEFGREIRYAAFTPAELRYRLTIQDRLLRDTLDYPHLILLDKTRLL